jgi:hypothetical protein
MTDVRADAAQLHHGSKGYQDVADRVAAIYRVLSTKLETEGACWGNDAAGQTFAKKYVPSALSVLSQMDSTNQGVQSMVDGICSWAKNYLDTMAADTADAHALGSAVSGAYQGSGIDTAVRSAGL